MLYYYYNIRLTMPNRSSIMVSMNKLSTEQWVRVISALVEGCSIRSTVRMTGVAKNTVIKLLCGMGEACKAYHDENVCSLETKRVQVDEIWSFVGVKNQNCKKRHYGKGYGDCWTWVALDAKSKLVISWLVGLRSGGYANVFVADLASRLSDRIQMTSDGWAPYREAVNLAFGTEVDYAMLIKTYAQDRVGEARYSPPVCVAARPEPMVGDPDPDHISTSYVEHQNLTMRMGMRRFTRLTNAFSKKLENHGHMIALHFMYYNFCRIHQTLRVTPAMEAKLTDHVWEIEELVGLMG